MTSSLHLLCGIVVITIIDTLLQMLLLLRLSVAGSGDGRLLHQMGRVSLLLGDVLHRLHELLLVVLLLVAARGLLLEGKRISLLHWLLD